MPLLLNGHLYTFKVRLISLIDFIYDLLALRSTPLPSLQVTTHMHTHSNHTHYMFTHELYQQFNLTITLVSIQF